MDKTKLPVHVSLIMDGNGRWAQRQGKNRVYGHFEGVESVRAVMSASVEMGIKYVSFFAFSEENWNRPDDEVNALMKLLRNYMKTCLKMAAQNDMKVRVIGDKTRLDDDIRSRISELEEATKNNGGLNFQIALNYGSRDEMIRAVGNAGGVIGLNQCPEFLYPGSTENRLEDMVAHLQHIRNVGTREQSMSREWKNRCKQGRS